MKEPVFALEFRGSATPVLGAEEKFRARTGATGQVWRTALTGKGLQARVDEGRRGSATFESEVQIVGEGTFLEAASITYGRVGKVTFKTVGHGTLAPSGVEGLLRGAVIWEVTGGEE